MTAGFDLPNISSLISREIAKGESNELEFKESKPSKDRKYVKTAIAFANCSGGKILFGVDNSGNVVGIPDDILFKTIDSITQTLNDSICPQMFFDMCVADIDGKNVIVAEFVPGLNTPYHLKKCSIDSSTYIRMNATTVLADSGIIRSLEARGNNSSFDAIAMNTLEVTFEKAEKLCRKISGIDAEIESLVNLGIISEIPHGYAATRAFALLTDNPFPYAAVHCIRFRGNDPSSVNESVDLTGSLFSQIDGAMEFISTHIARRFEMDGILHVDRYEIPLLAIREAVVNAVVHRDYFLDSFSIFIRIFDDRMEIESPGIPYKLTMDQVLSGYSSSRNPVLAAAFKRKGYIESYGTGIRKIIGLCEENGSLDPEFEVRHQHFRVTFPRGKKTPDMIMEEDEYAVMKAIEADGRMSQSAISQKTGVDLSKVKRLTLALQQKNLIVRQGNSRSGCWLLNPEISYGLRK